MTLELNLRFADLNHFIVSLSGDRTKILEFVSPFAAKDHEEIRWYVETYAAHYTTDVDDAEARRIEAQLPKWGTALFKAIFCDRAAQSLYDRFRSTTSQDRLLTISAEHPLPLSLPWELLRDSKAFYLLDAEPPISIRRGGAAAGGPPALRPKIKPCLRLLFVTSRPSKFGFMDPRAESQAVMDAVEQHAPGRIEIEFLRPAVFRKLAERLENKSLPAIDVIHFDGHGEYDIHGRTGDNTPNTGYLIFETSAGYPQYISPKFWHDTLGDCGVSLVLLSACQSASMGDGEDAGETQEPMGSFAYGLTASGVQAVLAMSHSVLTETTSQLFGQFYGQLALGKGIGAALDSARHHLMKHPEKREVQRGTQRMQLTLQDWFVPALYQTGNDTPLLDAEGDTGLVSELPARRESGFFGRQQELWDIERRFVGGTRQVSITGFGGQGKTQLAAEAGRWLQRTGMFDRVAVVGYAAFQGIDATGFAIATLGSALNENLADENAVAKVLTRVPTLLVLDNLEALDQAPLAELLSVADAWSSCGDSRILMTSRTPHVADSKRHRGITLTGLGEQDALDYFQSLMKQPPAPQLDSPSHETLRTLFKRVDFHPLSLRLLAEQLKTRRVEELGERLEVLLAQGGDDKDKSLRASLQLSLDKLDAESKAGLPPLGVLQGGAMETGLLSITEQSLRFIQGNFGVDMLGEVSIGESKWTRAREPLQAAALIALELLPGVGVPYVRFHPTIAPLLWSLVPQPERDALIIKHRLWYYQLSSYLFNEDLRHPDQMRAIAGRELPNLLHAVQGALKAGEDWAVRFSHNVIHFLKLFGLNRDVAALTEQIAAQPKNGAPARTEEALPWLVQSSQQERASEAQRLARLTHGQQLLQSGDAAAASIVFQEVLDSLADRPSFRSCEALIWLGRCFQDLGQLGRAEMVFRDALALVDVLEQTDVVNQRRVRMGQLDLSKHHRASLQVDLGNVLTEMGRYHEARMAFNSALAASRELGSSRDEGVVVSQLGGLALAEGDLQEAAARYQEAISICQRLREPAGEAMALHQLGMVLQRNSQLEDAEDCYRESARIAESNGNLLRVAGTWDQLAQISAILGKSQAAEAWFRKALEARRHIGDVVGLSTTLGNLGDFLAHEPGRLSEAHELAEESAAIKQTLDPGAAAVWTVYLTLAKIADKQNKPAQARAYRRQARAAFGNLPSSRHEVRRYGRLIAPTIVTVDLPHLRPETEPQLASLEQEGWADLVAVCRRILDGERDVDALCDTLGVVEGVVVETILEGIKDPSSLNHLLGDD